MRAFIAAALALGPLLGCDDTPVGPTEPNEAQFTLTVGERDWWPNENPEKEYWLTAELTIRETAGLGGSIDFLRLEGKGPGGTYEKAEIGSDLIVAALGTNRVRRAPRGAIRLAGSGTCRTPGATRSPFNSRTTGAMSRLSYLGTTAIQTDGDSPS